LGDFGSLVAKLSQTFDQTLPKQFWKKLLILPASLFYL
jgi:hypothetical protein